MLFLLSIFTVGTTNVSFANPFPSVQVSTPGNVVVGDTFTVKVLLKSSNYVISGAGFTFRFKSDLVELVESEVGFAPFDKVWEDTVNLNVITSYVTGGPSSNNTVTLATYTFIARSTGNAFFDLTG